MATDADRARLAAWAVMLRPDKNVNRRQSRRTVPLEVLSLGFSRTRTLTMVEALKILRYPEPYHSSFFANVKDPNMWQEAFKLKYGHGEIGLGGVKKGPGGGDGNFDWRGFFDRLLGHCGAVSDSPAVFFWENSSKRIQKPRSLSSRGMSTNASQALVSSSRACSNRWRNTSSAIPIHYDSAASSVLGRPGSAPSSAAPICRRRRETPGRHIRRTTSEYTPTYRRRG